MADEELPEFALAMRGYDRQQVDDYVRTLRQYLEEMSTRTTNAEQAAGEQARAAADSHGAGRDPYSSLGDRVTGILREAENAASQMRQDAERDAAGLLVEARRSAATSNDTVVRAQAQADQLLSAARDDAQRLLARFRDHAEQQAAALLSEAETEARQVREQALAQAEQTRSSIQDDKRRLQEEIQELHSRHRQARDSLTALRSSLTFPDEQQTDNTASNDAAGRVDRPQGPSANGPQAQQVTPPTTAGERDATDAPTVVLHRRTRHEALGLASPGR